MEIRHGLTPSRRLLPALVGGVMIAAAITAFFVTRAAADHVSSTTVQSSADSAAATVSARLDADAELLTGASAAIGGDPHAAKAQLEAGLRRVQPTDRDLAVAIATADGGATVVEASDSRSPIMRLDLASPNDIRVVLELARDRGAAGATVTTGADGRLSVIDVLPLYGTPDVPGDIAARRAALKGFVLTSSPVTAIAALPGSPSPDISVRITAGTTTLAAVGRDVEGVPPTSATSVTITTNGVVWVVDAWATPRPSALPWFVLGGGLAIAALVIGIGVSRERSIVAAIAETEARNQELALVARTGPVLQQSLALGDLLPVFVVEIGDELGLDSTSISLVGDTGQLTRVFSLGSGTAAAEPELSTLSSPPKSARPGEVVTIPLQRLGRIVGAFQARAVTGLSPPQMETLQAVCALLAAAVGNVRLYQDEQEMVTKLRDIDRMKTSFIGSVSHELRTSVTAIQGFAGLLEADPELDADHRTDYIERISRNARSLGVLVEDLLDFARFERSGLAAALRPIDLSDLVPKVVEQMSSVLGGRPVSTVIEPDVVALADTLAVERVIANLLSNAGKYTPPDAAVEIGLERNDDDAVLCVTDHGPGIPADEREKIFELFYRSDASARVTRGVGIGLALTRQLVHHLDGTITVEDAPGGGARFRVTIPLADGASRSADAPRSEPATRGAGG